jgi:hypothetical protein
MPSFILRNLNPEFWQRVQAKAAAEGSTVKAVILRLLTAWLAAVVLVSIGACGYKNPVQPTTVEQPTAGVPTRIELTANPGMGAEAGTGTISARVLDAFATALPGQTLSFSVSEGALGASSVVTDDKGTARTTITGPPGAGITISATVGTVTQKTQIAMQSPPSATLPIVPPVFPPAPPTPPAPPPQPPQPPALTVKLTSSVGSVATAGGTITFSAAVTNLNGETITAFQWDVDDTAGFEGTSTLPSRVGGPYTTAGLFTATVKVTTSTGRSATGTVSYVVTN